MIRYLARCAAQFAVALVGIVTVAFFLMRAIPGDPALYMLGDFATAEALATLRACLGLDLPIAPASLTFLYQFFFLELFLK